MCNVSTPTEILQVNLLWFFHKNDWQSRSFCFRLERLECYTNSERIYLQRLFAESGMDDSFGLSFAALSNLSNNSSLFQILRNVQATLSWTLPIVPLVSKGVGRWSVTEMTSLLKLSGTALQVTREQGCLLRLLPNIIVEPMHRAGWMVNIRRRRMGLFRGRFASTGAITFVHGTCLSVSVTVGTSSCIVWEGHQHVIYVIVETKGMVSF